MPDVDSSANHYRILETAQDVSKDDKNQPRARKEESFRWDNTDLLTADGMYNPCGSPVDVKINPRTTEPVNMWKPGWTLLQMTTGNCGACKVQHSNGVTVDVENAQVRLSSVAELPSWMIDSSIDSLVKENTQAGIEMQVFMTAGPANEWVAVRFAIIWSQFLLQPLFLQMSSLWVCSTMTLAKLNPLFEWSLNVSILTVSLIAEWKAFKFVSAALVQHIPKPNLSPRLWFGKSMLESAIAVVGLQASSAWIAAEWRSCTCENADKSLIASLAFGSAIAVWMSRLLLVVVTILRVYPKAEAKLQRGIVTSPEFYASILEKSCSGEVAFSHLAKASKMTTYTQGQLAYIRSRMSMQLDSRGHFVLNSKAASERLFIRRCRLATEREAQQLVFEDLIVLGIGSFVKALRLAVQIQAHAQMDSNLIVAVISGMLSLVMQCIHASKHISFVKEVVQLVSSVLGATLTKEDERPDIESEVANLKRLVQRMVRGRCALIVLIFSTAVVLTIAIVGSQM